MARFADLPLAREPLPAFALALYGSEGVPAACLLLQERRDVDVNILLFAAFLGAVRGEALTTDVLARVREGVGPWHRDIVKSLRAVRKRLKAGPPPAPDAATAALRARVQAIEIEAEIIELAKLGRLAPSLCAPPGAGDPQARALAAMALVLGDAPLDVEEAAALDHIAQGAARLAGAA